MEVNSIIWVSQERPSGVRKGIVEAAGGHAGSVGVGAQGQEAPMSLPALQPPCPSADSNARILNEASGVEPGWVEIMPRKRVTDHVRTWLLSVQTGEPEGSRSGLAGEWPLPDLPEPRDDLLSKVSGSRPPLNSSLSSSSLPQNSKLIRRHFRGKED